MRKCFFLAFLGLASVGWCDSTTNRLGLTLPTVGSPTWGQKVNGNFQILDATTNLNGFGPYVSTNSITAGANVMVSTTATGVSIASTGGGSSLSGPPGAIPFMSPSSTAAFDSNINYSSTTQILSVPNILTSSETINGNLSLFNVNGQLYFFPGNFVSNPQIYTGGQTLSFGGTFQLPNFTLSGTSLNLYNNSWIARPTGISENVNVQFTSDVVLANGQGVAGQCFQSEAGSAPQWGTCGGGGSSIYPATATASFPYGMSVSTIAGTGSGPATESVNGYSGPIVFSTGTPTAGQCAMFASSYTAVGITCPTGGGGSPAGPAWSVQSSSAGAFGGWANLTNNGSTVTFTGVYTETQTGISTITISTDSAGNGLLVIVSSPAVLIITSMTFTSTGTATITPFSALSVTASTAVVSSSFTTANLSFSTSPIVTGAYSATCANSVILASSTLTTFSTVTLPSAASCPGQVIAYWKVDQDTGAAVLLANGSDLIIGTGTWKFYSHDQGGMIQSDGISAWHSAGVWNANPAWAGVPGNFLYDTGEPVATSSNTNVTGFMTTSPAMYCGFRFNISASGGGGTQAGCGTDAATCSNYGVWDAYTQALVISTGPILNTTTGWQNLMTSVPFFLNGNYPYLVGVQPSNTVAKYITTNAASTPSMGCYLQTTGGGLTIPTSYTSTTAGTMCPYITLIPCGGVWTK